jgi:hypothetical protein
MSGCTASANAPADGAAAFHSGYSRSTSVRPSVLRRIHRHHNGAAPCLPSEAARPCSGSIVTRAGIPPKSLPRYTATKSECAGTPSGARTRACHPVPAGASPYDFGKRALAEQSARVASIADSVMEPVEVTKTNSDLAVVAVDGQTSEVSAALIHDNRRIAGVDAAGAVLGSG